MNISKLSIIFAIVIITAFLPLSWFTNAGTVMARRSQEIQNDMTCAAYDAMQAVTVEDDHAFGTTTQRSEALDSFYMSLASSNGLVAAGGISEAVISSHIPFVALIDSDGVYVAYSKDYNTWGNSEKRTYKVSPVTTYSESYTLSGGEQYTIQFKLNNTATVYYNGSKIADGNYKELKAALQDLKNERKDGYGAYDLLKFMETKEKFNEEKQIVITNVVVRTVENYMNENMATDKNNLTNGKNGYNIHNAQYKIVIPQDRKADFANALTSPTVISFYQGDQIQTGNTYVMTFALTGGEMSDMDKYFITKEGDTLYYHSSTTCPHFRGHLGGKDTDSGKYISEERYYTMEEAATMGAYPCPDCVH